MPQMSPMYWEFLNISLCFLVLTSALKIYYYKTPSSLEIVNKSADFSQSISLSWLW